MSLCKVTLWGATVGYLAWDAERACGVFEYDPAFRQSGVQLAPQTMPLADAVYAFPNLNRDTYKGLPGMLADALPDKFGNALIDQWLAETGRSAAEFNAVQRLTYVGTRGMGALEIQPALEETESGDLSLDVEELVELASRILTLREEQAFTLDGRSSESKLEGLGKILAVGTSAGGARAKAIIAWNEQTQTVRSGQVEAGDGYGYWLLKFDGVSHNRDKELTDPLGYGRIEYAYSLMARAAGIDMTDCRLLEENGRAHFMTRRFDRTEDGQKLYMQSLCALGHYDFNLPGATSYEQAFAMCNTLGLGMADREQLFLRMAFNVLAYNRDDHTKQIAFLMDKAGRWRLSPAFDMTYAYNPRGEFTSTHQMTVNRKREGIVEEDFLAVAKRQGLNMAAARRLVSDVREAIAGWTGFAQEAQLSAQRVQQIGELLQASSR